MPVASLHKFNIPAGTASQRVFVYVQNITSNLGITGLTAGSPGLVCYRGRLDDGNTGGTQLVLQTMTRGSWTSGGFVEKDSANLPGVYELGLDNAGLTTGSNMVLYSLTGVTGMMPIAMEIYIGLHGGIGALPQVALGSTGGLPSIGTGPAQINVDGAGNVFTTITSNVKKNTASSGFMFLMTDNINHNPLLGASVTAQRSLNGAPFAACANSAVEVSNGVYTINLAGSDLNANYVVLLFTAPSADNKYYEIITQP